MPHSSSHDKPFGDERTDPLRYCLYIGISAGAIWGLVRWLAVAMKLTTVPQAFLIDPWVPRSDLVHSHWQIIGFLLFVAMSVVAAFAYYLLFGRLRGPMPGLVFGIGWWAVFYLGIGPMIGAVPPLNRIGWNSIFTDLSLYAVWGLFIGYSIAFEFHDEASREPESAGA